MSQTTVNSEDEAQKYNLARFVDAQAREYTAALAELNNGRKRSHWMWYIFPQIAGLGSSPNSQHYAIRSLDEARAYLSHPLLGSRLRECAAVVLGTEGKSARDIFGTPDDVKLHSCLTLFAQVTEPEGVFPLVLAKYFGGQLDEQTLRLLAASAQQQAVLQSLSEYVPYADDDRRSVEETAQFVRDNARFGERTLEEGHVTASAWVVDAAGENALLTHHAKLNKWVQLGGHLEAGDGSVAEAARREAREESGLTSVRLVSERIFDVDVHPIPARGEVPAHFHYDLRFLCVADRGEPLHISDESHDVAWVALAEVPTLTEERSVLRMLAKSAAGQEQKQEKRAGV